MPTKLGQVFQPGQIVVNDTTGECFQVISVDIAYRVSNCRTDWCLRPDKDKVRAATSEEEATSLFGKMPTGSSSE